MKKAILGSLKLVFLINFWKLTEYQYFRAKSCRIQQPYTINIKNKTVWKQLWHFITDLSHCVCQCPKHIQKRFLCGRSSDPIQNLVNTRISEFDNLSLKISKMRVFGKKNHTSIITYLSHCVCYRPNKVFVWMVKWPPYKKSDHDLKVVEFCNFWSWNTDRNTLAKFLTQFL